jgi:DtxR family transcriptional regulator, Mn-dependent transcriptional regulator
MAELPATRSTHPRQRRRAGSDGPTNKERDYLEIIYYLAQRDEPVIAAHVARWLSLQPPTVSHALQEMEKKAYIQRDERGEISLTTAGYELAEAVIRRHRIIERFLADVVGVPWHLLHEEAVQLEHALSPMLEDRFTALLSDTKTCPHGNPIPGSGATYAGATRLDRAEVGTMFTIRRIEEEAEERTEFLRYLEAQRLLPGNQFFIPDASPAYGITLRGCNRDMTVSPEIAAVIWGDSTPIDQVAK